MGEVIFTGYYSVFAERLRGLMSESGTTQKELAGVIGITRQAISQYMDGSIQPNIEKLFKIAVFFKVSADYLLRMSDVKSLDLDDKIISEKLGFNEKAIETIESLSEREDTYHNLDVPRSEDFVAMDVLNSMLDIDIMVDHVSFFSLMHDIWLYVLEEVLFEELNQWALPIYLRKRNMVFDKQEHQYYENGKKIEEKVILKNFKHYAYRFILSIFDQRVEREYAMFKLTKQFEKICEKTSKKIVNKVNTSDIYNRNLKIYKSKYEEFFDENPPGSFELSMGFPQEV